MSTPNAAKLRDIIAEALWAHVSAYDLANLCDVVGMPPAEPDSDPMLSKRRYVRARLLPLGAVELAAIASELCDHVENEELAAIAKVVGMRGVDGALKNLIFAAHGPKPRIILRDAINNVIEIVENAENCLVYDEPPHTSRSLTWGELVRWWARARGLGPTEDAARNLYARLVASLASEPERVLFKAYGRRYGQPGADDLPALIPQVYLHYDPYTLRELRGREGQVLARQRMDFLMLLPNKARVVIEVDGKQHYADGDRASPGRYAEMVAEDRDLRLAGYEIYRFGGAELAAGDAAAERVNAFFDRLLERHIPS
jgi:very-short-patch-repair endonuclease